jgi:mannosyltransferase
MPRAAVTALLAITLLAGVLRVHNLGRDSLWEDEAASVLYTHLPVHVLLIHNVDPGNPPGYRLLLKGWIAICGTSEFAVRLPSALLGTATVPLVGLLAWLLTRRTAAALAAALLLALSPHHVYYSQEARAYALVVLLATGGTCLLIRALRDNRRRDWCGYAVLAALGVYMHYQGFFVIVGQTLATLTVLMLRRTPRAGWRAPVWAHLAIAAGVLPCLIAYLGRGLLAPGVYPHWQERASWAAFRRLLGEWTVGVDFQYVLPALPLVIVVVSLIVLPGLLLVWLSRRHADPLPLAVAVVLYGGAGAFAALTSFRSLWHVKYLLAFQPLFMVGLAAGLALLPRRWGRAGAGVSIVATAGAALILLLGLIDLQRWSWKPDYAAAVRHILARDPQRAAPVYVPHFAYVSVNHYYAAADTPYAVPTDLLADTRGAPTDGTIVRALVTRNTPQIRTESHLPTFVAEVRAAAAAHDVVYVVLSESQLGDGCPQVIAALDQHLDQHEHHHAHRVHVLTYRARPVVPTEEPAV